MRLGAPRVPFVIRLSDLHMTIRPATSVGFPIRNMHTTSELAHTGDVLAAISALTGWLEDVAASKLTAADFKQGHPRLDFAVAGHVNGTAAGGAGEVN